MLGQEPTRGRSWNPSSGLWLRKTTGRALCFSSLRVTAYCRRLSSVRSSGAGDRLFLGDRAVRQFALQDANFDVYAQLCI